MKKINPLYTTIVGIVLMGVFYLIPNLGRDIIWTFFTWILGVLLIIIGFAGLVERLIKRNKN